ncbi:HD-GYP domain-containing protein [Gemmatimonas sp.]|uniref:HD-GYP domain-containing protein n=2 Tax=Gemmatimonas sp. TaxID=1962908 RepID=UPI0035616E5F
MLADRANLDRAALALELGDIPLHSTNVARYAVGIATSMGADADMYRDILRAGLLHDIGKLGVSNQILDNRAKLTDEEFGEFRKHPRWTWEILERVNAFDSHVADAAAALVERGMFMVLAEGRDDPFPQLRQELAKFVRIASVA